MMSRVVDNQNEAFRNDPILSQIAQGVQIKYGGCPHAKEPERRQTFIRNCADRMLPITIAMHGINLELSLSSYEQSNNDVSFESEFIFNGVCVRFKGRLNKHTLIGQAHIEFNPERAEHERQLAMGALMHAQRIAALRNSIIQ